MPVASRPVPIKERLGLEAMALATAATPVTTKKAGNQG
jgi:hypothetical protein